MTTKTFHPTDAMVRAAETLFMAMAYVEFLKPIVLGYKRDLLTKGQWTIRPQYATRLGAEVILEPERAYLMSDEDFAVFDSQCKAARDAAKLTVDNPDQCPLLVAESLVIHAEHALVEAMFEHGKLTVDRLLCAGLDTYKKYVDLCLKLLAPFVKDAPAILAKVAPQPIGMPT